LQNNYAFYLKLKRGWASMLMKSQIISEQHEINIKFTNELPLHKVVTNLSEISSPHIILWYIGSYGLKKGCVEFYRNNLISPILAQNSEATFWLVDLTAWHAFKSPNGSILKASSCSRVIQNYNDHRIKCLPSSEIFHRMSEITDEYIIDHFTEIFTQVSFQHISSNHNLMGITVGEIFSKKIPLLDALINMDISKAYSPIQFLEGCLIVETILKSIANHVKTNSVEVVFALPNDELKYYTVERDLFKRSIEMMILQMYRQAGIDWLNLNLSFLAFQFGNQQEHRPYNIPGDCVKKNELSIGDIIGNEHVSTIFQEECAF
jgi:hypothetical protein